MFPFNNWSPGNGDGTAAAAAATTTTTTAAARRGRPGGAERRRRRSMSPFPKKPKYFCHLFFFFLNTLGLRLYSLGPRRGRGCPEGGGGWRGRIRWGEGGGGEREGERKGGGKETTGDKFRFLNYFWEKLFLSGKEWQGWQESLRAWGYTQDKGAGEQPGGENKLFLQRNWLIYCVLFLFPRERIWSQAPLGEEMDGVLNLFFPWYQKCSILVAWNKPILFSAFFIPS